MTTAQVRGQEAERRAAEFLVRRGLRVIERNYRIRGGELDLVCRDGRTIVFVEVRARSRSDFGGAGESITAAKRRRLVLAAQSWLLCHGEQPCRFDCVLIDAGKLVWLRDAFLVA
jgi:putative endonuclease